MRAGWNVVAPAYRLPGRISEAVARTGKTARCIAEPGAVIHPSARISNNRDRNSIRIGAGSHIRGFLETLPHGGSIRIGRDCFVGEGSYVWSAASIEIGDRVLISHGVNIHDHIAHSLYAGSRHAHFVETVTHGAPSVLEDVPSAPVVIEDDAWIGFNATILKGVRIGRGAVVGAQTLVTKDVEPFTIVAGNPPRVIGPSFR